MDKKIIPFIVACLLIFAITYFLSYNKTENPEDQIFTEEDLEQELQKLHRMNKYPNNKLINSDKYPKYLGEYSKNGMDLSEIYFCSDVCPDYARVYIVYTDVTSEECLEIEGSYQLKDAAWGGYIGCSPVDSESFFG